MFESGRRELHLYYLLFAKLGLDDGIASCAASSYHLALVGRLLGIAVQAGSR